MKGARVPVRDHLGRVEVGREEETGSGTRLHISLVEAVAAVRLLFLGSRPHCTEAATALAAAAGYGGPEGDTRMGTSPLSSTVSEVLSYMRQ